MFGGVSGVGGAKPCDREVRSLRVSRSSSGCVAISSAGLCCDVLLDWCDAESSSSDWNDSSVLV